MKKIQNILILFFLFTGLIRVNAQTTPEIEKATKLGKAVFLVVFNANVQDPTKAVTIANDAKKNSKSSAVVIKMNAADASNSDLISKYGLKGVGLPTILVLDKNGNAAGGLFITDATAEKLVGLIPSPKTSELIKALAEGKAVYIIVYKESMTSKKGIVDNCAVACSQMDNKCVTVMVDMDDKKETKLLQNLKYEPTAKEPVTYVINKAGQVIGQYNGVADVNTLVSSAKKAPAGGCCPGGAKTGGCKK
jgi:hypothetical protein